jgi:predicted transcriptional regulator
MIEESAHIEISLPPDLAERVDAAVERMGRRHAIQSRQEFAVAAIEWSLYSLEAGDVLTEMGLDIDS